MPKPAPPLAVVVALLALLALSPSASAQVPSQPMCPGAQPATVFLEWPNAFENLAFDGNGSLYLSAIGTSILRALPDGSLQSAIADVPVLGLVWGPDDRLYASLKADAGATAPNEQPLFDIVRSTDSTVTALETYVAGVPVFNGMAFGHDGALFVSDEDALAPDTPPNLIRIDPATPETWTPWTDIYGPDGLAVDPLSDSMYTAIVSDSTSDIVRLSTTDPTVAEVVAQLSFGAIDTSPNVHAPEGDMRSPLPKGPDDLTVGPDGRLYIAGHVSGEVLRLDLTDGSVCVLANGLGEAGSVRFAHGFGEYDGKLFVTSYDGVGVTGFAAYEAGLPTQGKVWVLDVPALDASGTGVPANTPVVETPSASSSPAQGAPLPFALVPLALLAALVGSRATSRLETAKPCAKSSEE